MGTLAFGDRSWVYKNAFGHFPAHAAAFEINTTDRECSTKSLDKNNACLPCMPIVVFGPYARTRPRDIRLPEHFQTLAPERR